MEEGRMKILQMLSEAKITAEEAAKLLDALDQNSETRDTQESQGKETRSKLLYISVHRKDSLDSKDVQIKIPTAIIQSGIQFKSFIPKSAREHLGDSIELNGEEFSFNDIDKEQMDYIFSAMQENSIDIETERATVRMYCR
ncbi:MAG: hypothetical protein RBT04_09155 [Sphaerochaetaceae bacterium]|nr:hypothetical protein [Sphaerochaetaceae bacterium]